MHRPLAQDRMELRWTTRRTSTTSLGTLVRKASRACSGLAIYIASTTTPRQTFASSSLWETQRQPNGRQRTPHGPLSPNHPHSHYLSASGNGVSFGVSGFTTNPLAGLNTSIEVADATPVHRKQFRYRPNRRPHSKREPRKGWPQISFALHRHSIARRHFASARIAVNGLMFTISVA